MVVTEGTVAGLDAVRGHVLTDESFAIPAQPGEHFFLTERPYSARRLRSLLDQACKFKRCNFPQSQLQAMYEALFQSKVRAQLATRSTLMHAKKEHWEVAQEFFAAMGVSEGLMPWHELRTLEFATPLGDLVEIYPFVGRS